ncbi:MAG: hypothetical protein ACFE96_00585 [Candidatus Hermodarchaeota archaeon]
MPEKKLETQVKELEAKLHSQDSEIQEYLDKIESLEDLIMELEDSILKQSDDIDASILKIRVKDLENENRELKNKLSVSKLENIKLKRDIEKVKKGQLDNISLIKVEDEVPDSESEAFLDRQEIFEESEPSEKAEFRYLTLTCPECETKKKLSIPIKFINQGHQISTISVPKGKVCEHKFQVFFDKSLTVNRYQVIDYNFPHLEYFESRFSDDPRDSAQFTPLPFIQNIVTLLRNIVDDREILGTAVFTNKGKVIYASVPSDILINIIKEFEVRREKQLQDIDKMFLELKNHQKVCSEYIEVQNKEFILVLIFSKKVNFGLGSMLFRNIKKKIKNLTSKS